MDDQSNAGELDSFTRGFVRKCARQLVGKFGFQQQDREDIEQQLYLKLAKRLRGANASDPLWKAFVAVSVRRHIVSMVRVREAEKRDHRQTCSIHVRVGGLEGSVDIATTLTTSEIPSHRNHVERAEQEFIDLALDVSDCIAELSDSVQKEFLERLKTDSIAQIARDMDIPRTTLNSWILKLRKQFESCGLKDYL